MPGVGDSAVPGSTPAWGLSTQLNEACSCRGVDVCTHSPGPGPTEVPLSQPTLSQHPWPPSPTKTPHTGVCTLAMFTADITGNKDILSSTSPSPEHPYPVPALSPAPSSTAGLREHQALSKLLGTCLTQHPCVWL